jgi:hypothetical protein
VDEAGLQQVEPLDELINLDLGFWIWFGGNYLHYMIFLGNGLKLLYKIVHEISV